MYYYANLNENDICISTQSNSEMLSDLPSNLIYLGTEPLDVVGMKYNRETASWEEVAYNYYIKLNDVNVVLETVSTTETITDESYTQVTEEVFNSAYEFAVYYKDSFMDMQEAIYRMLFAITSISK